MTRETLNQEASEASDTLADVLEEALRHDRDHHGRDTGVLFHGEAVVDTVYERARAAARAALLSLEGTEDERAARDKARATALRAAVVASYHEEGFGDCDHCGRLATFTWQRTAKELKRMAGPKVKGSRTQALPVSWRCATHVPHAFPELGDNYRDARVLLAAAA